MRLAIGVSLCRFINQNAPGWLPIPATYTRRMPEEKRPDVRPQLRDFLEWYEEVLGRIESGAVVAPGEQERLTEEASAVAHLLDLLDSSADQRGRAAS
jgi:hypothetical protein